MIEVGLFVLLFVALLYNFYQDYRFHLERMEMFETIEDAIEELTVKVGLIAEKE